jgi:N-acetylmuramoyl-L-alanine amidase
MIKKLSPNFSKGWNIAPQLVVIHWTAGKFEPSLNWMLDKKAQASAHYIINTNGETVKMVELTDRAWHAGQSFTKKFGSYANNYSYGIELVGPPSIVGDTWNDEQINACIETINEIKKSNGHVRYICDHSFISPGRKIDVRKGEGIDSFPWNDLVKKTGLIDLTAL